MWDWKRRPSDSQKIVELEEANNLLCHFSLNEGMDHWVSKISGDGVFYVKDLRALIDNNLTTPMDNPI